MHRGGGGEFSPRENSDIYLLCSKILCTALLFIILFFTLIYVMCFFCLNSVTWVFFVSGDIVFGGGGGGGGGGVVGFFCHVGFLSVSQLCTFVKKF